MPDQPLPFDPERHGWTRLDDSGYSRLIGPFWRRGEGEASAFGVLTTQDHVNRNGTVHGGVILGLTDHALGHVSSQTTGGLTQVTVQLDMHFLAAPRHGDFVIVWGTVVRKTRSLMFLRGDLTVDERPVAAASGIWRIFGAA